jgi:hypothetical protein
MFTQPDAAYYSWIKFPLETVKRFVALCGSTTFTILLSVYRHPNRTVFLLTGLEVARFMRDVAAKAYNLDSRTSAGNTALSTWLFHSLRVGAIFVVASYDGFYSTPTQILRWKSDAFMVYRRNITYLSDQLNRAIMLAAYGHQNHSWESIPDRREPFTVEMLNAMHDGTFGQHDHLSLFACCRDWFGSGMYTGYRRTEFCQDSSRTVAMRDTFKNTKAFCLPDVTWQLTNGTRLEGADCLNYPCSTISKGWLRWRTQKNGDNGDKRMFTQPDADNYSWIKFLYSIVKRFVALRGPTDCTYPLSAYRHSNGKVYMLTAVDVERVMREVAARVYNLDPSTPAGRSALQKWSCHSLRVGACVLLHTMGFTEPQIKWILRWKSDAFMRYLRNITNLSDKHTTALNLAAHGRQNPNFSINDEGEQPNVL